MEGSDLYEPLDGERDKGFVIRREGMPPVIDFGPRPAEKQYAPTPFPFLDSALSETSAAQSSAPKETTAPAEEPAADQQPAESSVHEQPAEQPTEIRHREEPAQSERPEPEHSSADTGNQREEAPEQPEQAAGGGNVPPPETPKTAQGGPDDEGENGPQDNGNGDRQDDILEGARAAAEASAKDAKDDASEPTVAPQVNKSIPAQRDVPDQERTNAPVEEGALGTPSIEAEPTDTEVRDAVNEFIDQARYGQQTEGDESTTTDTPGDDTDEIEVDQDALDAIGLAHSADEGEVLEHLGDSGEPETEGGDDLDRELDALLERSQGEVLDQLREREARDRDEVPGDDPVGDEMKNLADALEGLRPMSEAAGEEVGREIREKDKRDFQEGSPDGIGIPDGTAQEPPTATEGSDRPEGFRMEITGLDEVQGVPGPEQQPSDFNVEPGEGSDQTSADIPDDPSALPEKQDTSEDPEEDSTARDHKAADERGLPGLRGLVSQMGTLLNEEPFRSENPANYDPNTEGARPEDVNPHDDTTSSELPRRERPEGVDDGSDTGYVPPDVSPNDLGRIADHLREGPEGEPDSPASPSDQGQGNDGIPPTSENPEDPEAG